MCHHADIIFSIMSMGDFGNHRNQSFDPNAPKPYAAPRILNVKFEQDWPTGLKKIFKFESVNRLCSGQGQIWH